MCFSAEMSFGASAVVTTIGVISIKKSKTTSLQVLACIPLMFGLQQFSEGVLWLSLYRPGMSNWVPVCTYIFLIFAQVVWPLIVPFSVYFIEKAKLKKSIMAFLCVWGTVVSLCLAYTLISGGAQASVSCEHIFYDIHYPTLFQHKGIIYFIPTVLPPLISSHKRVRLFGVVVLVTFIATKIIYQQFLVSVWCFFGAIVSIMILSIVIHLNKTLTVKIPLE